MPPVHKTPATIRPAQPADAPAINALYREAYTPPGPNHADCQYPFAQFLDPLWVAHAVELKLIRWIVAEYDGHVVGTTGAVRNIGSDADRVAECFGLVVTGSVRKRGIGAALFRSICDMLSTEADFIIAEVRTVSPGGWRIVRQCGFSPLGFEPFAHTTPVGSESMLLTGKISDQARDRRVLRNKTGSTTVNRLGRGVLGPIGLPPLPDEIQATPQPVHVQSFKTLAPDLVPVKKANSPAPTMDVDDETLFEVVRSVASEEQVIHRVEDTNPHESGVVCLHRLEGEDLVGKRYDRRSYIGRVGNRVLASARLVWDRLDRRVRILDLQTEYHGLQGMMFARILHDVEQETRSDPIAVVIDVRADRPELHATLERLGFFPTVYYPAMIDVEDGRMDAVQFTWLCGQSLDASAKAIGNHDWDDAQTVISRVTLP